MHTFKMVLLACLAVIFVVIAFANYTIVNLSILPRWMADFFNVDWQISLPLYLVVLLSLLFGVIIGFTWAWARARRKRSGGGQDSRRLQQLEKEVAALRSTQKKPSHNADISDILDAPKTRA